MKKVIMMLIIISSISSVAFSQTNIANAKKIQARIIAIEKAGWQAWQDKNVDWYKKNTTDDFLMVLGEGTRNKADVLKATASECDVKSFSLSDFKFVMLNENAVLMNYTADQDAMCGGKASAPKVRASVNYVKRGGKWLEAFYTETPLTQ